MLLNLSSNAIIKKALETQPIEKLVSAVIDLPDDCDISDLVIDQLRSDSWSVAVEPLLISLDTDDDKRTRAELIIDLIVTESLKDKKFLDFGCGNGYVAEVAKKQSGAAVSIGYDIVSDADWSKHSTAVLTVDKAEVERHAPYDTILAYDVLDHVMDNSQVEILRYLGGLLSPTGRIVVRFHPWCSKNGTHMYKSFNKAYAQFFLSEDAVKRYGFEQLPTTKVLHPRMTYNRWIRESGLKVQNMSLFSEQIDPAFLQGERASILLHSYGNSMGGKFPTESLSSQFWDFIVVKKQ